ncbi:hypothetical protein AVW11_24070 [Streptomyces amritsarensis]|uniref:Uncharacterized protein n=1 Tax=Streptomyces amritsarensis TaxID=681158 RepID=A0ABX3G027_9ACTN|nr:hypothetical protein [Streptomyces amritsarensis]OLZ62009.1 hypothetical protein AVW11_24070 [Streptomyces amritsarensis]
MDATRSERAGRFGGLHVWSATVTSVVALALSIINLILLQKDPRLDVSLPAVIRLDNYSGSGLVYIQPALTTSQDTDEVEVVRTLGLELRPAEEDRAVKDPHFIWRELGKWEYGEKSNALDYVVIGDPTPVVISRNQPQRPVALFSARDWIVTSGRYEGTLLVHRSEGEPPKTYRFCVYVSSADAAYLNDPRRSGFQLYRNDHPGTPPDHKGCYVSTATGSNTGTDTP